MEFINFNIVDFIDILLVSILIFQLYKMLKGTVAINIFIGIISIYLLAKIVDLLHMTLLGEILSQFIGVGVIAVMIVFQQEIRRFLIMLGTSATFNSSFLNPFKKLKINELNKKCNIIMTACKKMSSTKTGAIIVLTRTNEIESITENGESIDAKLSITMIENIFFKNNPLHDGAIVITNNRIISAKCILPISKSKNIPKHMGIRHRAAMGITELSDCIAICVSEQNGSISYFLNGTIYPNITLKKLNKKIQNDLKILVN